MLMLLTVFAWLLVLVSGSGFVSVITQMPRRWRDPGLWVSAALCAAVFLACLTGLGSVPMVPGVPLAVLLFGAGAIPGWHLSRPSPARRHTGGY